MLTASSLFLIKSQEYNSEVLLEYSRRYKKIASYFEPSVFFLKNIKLKDVIKLYKQSGIHLFDLVNRQTLYCTIQFIAKKIFPLSGIKIRAALKEKNSLQ